MPITSFTTAFLVSYSLVIIPTILVIVTAVLSARHTGGTLGQGIKKIAAGSIIDTILVATYIILGQGNKGLLSTNYVSLFFLISGLTGSILMIIGYYQIYQIAKKLKLFTV